MITIPVGLETSLLANVGTQFADVGTLAVVALAIGIPLAFYVIKKVIGLMPKK